MSKDQNEDKKLDKLEKTSTGGHLGGTEFGQSGGEAKTKDTREGGDKARPNDGN